MWKSPKPNPKRQARCLQLRALGGLETGQGPVQGGLGADTVDFRIALRQLVMDNVNFDGDQSINVEENAALGGILRQLADSGRGEA